MYARYSIWDFKFWSGKSLTRHSEPIPRLENGDRLCRHEFERRYEAMPNNQKAELIEGVVYLASPLRFEGHAEPHIAVLNDL